MHWIKSPGHRAVGSGGHQTNVDGDSRSGNDGHRRGTPLGEERDDVIVALPPAARGACNAAGRRVRLWPAILRHLGRGHGRSPDHRPHGGCSTFVDGGEPTNSGETASSIELWCWAESACGSGSCGDRRREHGWWLTQLLL